MCPRLDFQPFWESGVSLGGTRAHKKGWKSSLYVPTTGCFYVHEIIVYLYWYFIEFENSVVPWQSSLSSLCLLRVFVFRTRVIFKSFLQN